MNFVYLFPFTYFFNTRLRKGKIIFHIVFEWLAAVILLLLVGSFPANKTFLIAISSYSAFISLYEIGYLVNDLFASHKEVNGRKRGPQGVSNIWVRTWIISRCTVFLLLTTLLNNFASVEWWSFFIALCIVFSIHNVLTDYEMKVATFLWLAWFRFMAPLIFVVQDSQRMGVGLAAAIIYVTFRLLGYLDSKGLLQMPSRHQLEFRLFFFIHPLIGIVALWAYENAYGFLILTGYYAVVAILGSIGKIIWSRIQR
ncbi:MAG: hypothetical protein D3905_02960 [Candidatus Electrothrix sp. AS4_5]|nr:hypothetical protein [Candidatus Electrothrix gigas]MCI5188760.1 hypothetical protein [Candidatus Electrothrix gigas]